MQIQIWIGLALASGLLGLFISAAVGGACIAALSEASAWHKGSPFRRKFAEQVARLALYGLILWIASLAVAAAVIRAFPQWRAQVMQTAGADELLLLAGILAAGALLLAVFAASFKPMKRHPLGHSLLGLVSGVSLGGGFFWLLNLGLLLLPESAAGTPLALDFWPDSLQPAAAAMAWPAALQAGPFLLGGAGILAMPLLLLRRNKDDFGRDYYRFAVPCAAKWGLVFMLQAAGPALGFFLDGRPVPAWGLPLQLAAAAAAVLLLLTGVLSWIILRSAAPLRLKGTIVLAGMSAWLGGASALACEIWLLWPQAA